MSGDDPKVEFSGTFNAGTMQIAGHDMTVTGRTEGTIGSIQQQLANVATIRALLDDVPLSDPDRQAADDAVNRLQTELEKAQPDQSRAAHALDDLTTVLKAAGGLAGAGAALINPIGAIAVALGGAAASVLRAIGR
jgi:hypothetical protein